MGQRFPSFFLFIVKTSFRPNFLQYIRRGAIIRTVVTPPPFKICPPNPLTRNLHQIKGKQPFFFFSFLRNVRFGEEDEKCTDVNALGNDGRHRQGWQAHFLPAASRRHDALSLGTMATSINLHGAWRLLRRPRRADSLPPWLGPRLWIGPRCPLPRSSLWAPLRASADDRHSGTSP